MTSLFKFLFGCWIVLVIFFYMQPVTNEIQEQVPLPEFTHDIPDTSRVIVDYDWEKERFVYKDEKKILYQGKLIEYPAYPDFFMAPISNPDLRVRVQSGYKEEDIITVDHNRYRIWRKKNGEKTLIKLRSK